jgi:hypothetical protein
MNNDFLLLNWCSLQWTEWIKFSEAKKYRHEIPKDPGMYRIKAVGINRLVYIGQTGRDLRERLISHLITQTLKDEIPFNDPHTAAPSLWVWADANKWEYEFSVAPNHLPKPEREGLECYLLWQYRLEKGESTYCNHGRFHKDYIKSKARSSKFRGYKLFDSQPRNKAWGESFPPLKPIGYPMGEKYMGLEWFGFQELNSKFISDVPQSKGVYQLYSKEDNELLYIGQSKNIQKRLISHSKKEWGTEIVQFSYSLLPDIKENQLKEVENDLIGYYYFLTNGVPKYQFKNLS